VADLAQGICSILYIPERLATLLSILILIKRQNFSFFFFLVWAVFRLAHSI
jgi:hypothetical protein